jgi:hypothetical protein
VDEELEDILADCDDDELDEMGALADAMIEEGSWPQ